MNHTVKYLVSTMAILGVCSAAAEAGVEMGEQTQLQTTKPIQFKDTVTEAPGDRVAAYFVNGELVSKEHAIHSGQPYCWMEAYANLQRVPAGGVPLEPRRMAITGLDKNREWVRLEPTTLPLYLSCRDNSRDSQKKNVFVDAASKAMGDYLRIDSLVPAPPPPPYEKIKFEQPAQVQDSNTAA